jgi:prevent-host-death family protein
MRTTSLEEARAGLGELVDRARLAGEPTLITRYGRPVAVVVSEDWYRLAEDCLATVDGPGRPSIGTAGGQDDH